MRISQVNIYNFNRVSFKANENNYEHRITVEELLNDDVSSPRNYQSASDYIRVAYNDPKLIKKIRNKDFECIDMFETYRRTHLPTPIEPVKINCYRGEALLYTPNRLAPLRRKGVDTVIDLANIPDYDILCDLKKFKYYTFPLFNNYLDKPPFITRKEYLKTHKIPNTHLPDDSEEFAYDNEARYFIDNFKKLVSVINKGNFYICCNHGKIRTDAALLLNQYFNPKWDGDTSLKATPEQLEKFKNFYNSLSIRDKRDLGFTQEFEQALCKKLGIKDENS